MVCKVKLDTTPNKISPPSKLRRLSVALRGIIMNANNRVGPLYYVCYGTAATFGIGSFMARFPLGENVFFGILLDYVTQIYPMLIFGCLLLKESDHDREDWVIPGFILYCCAVCGCRGYGAYSLGRMGEEGCPSKVAVGHLPWICQGYVWLLTPHLAVMVLFIAAIGGFILLRCLGVCQDPIEREMARDRARERELVRDRDRATSQPTEQEEI